MTQWQFVHVYQNVQIDLTFRIVSTHTLTVNNAIGQVTANPALPTYGGLYDIYNTSTVARHYVGTATNIQERFNHRWQVCSELGLGHNDVTNIRVWAIQVYTGQHLTPPDNGGRTTGAGGTHPLDVEHFLIRTYLGFLRWEVRNTNKRLQFNDPFGNQISCTIADAAGVLGHQNVQFTLPSRASL
jgi:hypothetical protein